MAGTAEDFGAGPVPGVLRAVEPVGLWGRLSALALVGLVLGFARGLIAGLEAVIAGLTVHWSSGGTEGAVNRIKKIKRQL
jgi:hypothetical protein